jgi:hypothetical protein
MALGRVSGLMLKSNLERQGVDLAFETDLLYLDVINSRIGVKTSSPAVELDVSGDLAVSGTATITTELVAGNLSFAGNTLSSIDANGNIYITPDGTGKVIIGTTSDAGNYMLQVEGSIRATGDIIANGNITLGNADTDSITVVADFTSDLIPNEDDTYALGKDGQRWNAYLNTIYSSTDEDIVVDPLGTGRFVISDISKVSFGGGSAGYALVTDGAGVLTWQSLTQVGDFTFTGNTISTANTDQDVIIDPNGVGNIVLTGNVGINESDPIYTLSVVGTDAILVPVGTGTERPTTVTDGLIRYNSTTNSFEGYSNGQWISMGGDVTCTLESFTGDSVTSTFTLANAVDQNCAIVTLSGIVQNPGDSYAITGTQLDFSEPPGDGLEIRVRAFAQLSNLTASISSNTIEDVTDAGKVVDTWHHNTRNSADYFIQASNGVDFQNIRMQVLTNGSAVVKNEYGELHTNITLMDISVALNGGLVEVSVAANAGDTLTVKWSRNLL